MMMTILYRYSGETGTYTNPFTDVGSNRYYTNPIGWAYSIGLANGITDTTFEPDTTMNQQQLLTFLYRYATKYLNISYGSFSADLTGYTDYSLVNTYSKAAYQWALAYHIYDPGTSNYLYPRKSSTRADVALFITRFSFYIEGFTNSDTFTFNNSAYSASNTKGDLSSVYRMSNEVITLTKNTITSVSPSQITTLHTRLDEMLGSTNNGLCYGSCLAIYLDKIGKIDFNINTCNAATMSAVPKPRTNLAVESILTFYFFAQFIESNKPAFSAQRSTTSTPSTSFATLLTRISNAIDTYGPVFITLTGYNAELSTTYTHAVIFESYSLSYSNGTPIYTFNCLDPNHYFVSYGTYKMSYIPAGELFEYGILGVDPGSTEYFITKIECFTKNEMDFYDSYDFDTQYNTKSFS